MTETFYDRTTKVRGKKQVVLYANKFLIFFFFFLWFSRSRIFFIISASLAIESISCFIKGFWHYSFSFSRLSCFDPCFIKTIKSKVTPDLLSRIGAIASFQQRVSGNGVAGFLFYCQLWNRSHRNWNRGIGPHGELCSRKIFSLGYEVQYCYISTVNFNVLWRIIQQKVRSSFR